MLAELVIPVLFLGGLIMGLTLGYPGTECGRSTHQRQEDVLLQMTCPSGRHPCSLATDQLNHSAQQLTQRR